MKIKGRLLFMGWHITPWRVELANGKTEDIFPTISRFLSSLDKKRVRVRLRKESISILAHKKSTFTLEHRQGKNISLLNDNGFWTMNLGVVIESMLFRLAGRLIEIEIDDGNKMDIQLENMEQGKTRMRIGNCAVRNTGARTKSKKEATV